MIPFFLDPRPDELFYSVCARIQDAMRFDQKFSIGQYLFGNRYTNAVVDLPSRLGYVVDALPSGHRYTVDRLIDECTLLPFYTPFLPPSHVTHIRLSMGKREDEDSKWLGTVMGRHMLLGMLRFCPRCVEQERAELGMCYWHRLHQIPCVLVCPVHLVMLERSSIPMRHHEGSSVFVSAERAIQTIPTARMVTMEPGSQELIHLTENVAWLLTQRNLIIGPDALSLRYRSILNDQRLATSTGVVYWTKLSTAFTAYYSSQFFELLQIPGGVPAIVEAFKSTVSTYRYSRNPIYHLLLMQFLGYSPEAFFNHDPEQKPFGNRPWPCLNPACDHFKQAVIQNVEIAMHVGDSSRVRGTFACTCGFVYSRTGPDQSPDDRFRRTQIMAHGPVWEAKLRQLSEDPAVNFGEASRQLGVVVSAIKYHVDRLGLVFVTKQGVWTQPATEALPKRIVREQEYQRLREKHRTAWLGARQDNPSATVHQLRCMADAAYSWLRRNDKEWFLAHRPPTARAVSFKRAVDWNQRDEQLAREVKSYAEHLFKLPGRPRRITERRILIHLDPLVKRKKYKQRMPLTIQALSEVTETREAYIIRKIEWFATQFQYAQKIPSWTRLRDLASMPNDVLTPAIMRAIDAALEMLRRTVKP